MALISLHSFIAPKNPMAQLSCIRTEAHQRFTRRSGMCWRNTWLQKVIRYIAPNYRGSTGYGVEFEHANYDDWGVGDTQDCLHGAKYLRTLPGR